MQELPVFKPRLIAALKHLACFATFFVTVTVGAEPVRIGTSDTGIQTLLIPQPSRISPAAKLSSPFSLDTHEQNRAFVSHGTLSYLTIFQGLGSEYQLVSLAEVGHYPTLEDTGDGYEVGGTAVFNKQDNGQKFFEVHTSAGAQVVYIGWPLNAGNAIIEESYLRKMVTLGIVFVEVAPAIDESRGFVIGDDDRYSLLVGAVDANGRLSPSSRREGVDIFCPATIALPGGFSFNDTSAAAAICTRYVAQLKAIDSSLNLQDVREILTKTGDPAPLGATAKVVNIERALTYIRELKSTSPAR